MTAATLRSLRLAASLAAASLVLLMLAAAAGCEQKATVTQPPSPSGGIEGKIISVSKAPDGTIGSFLVTASKGGGSSVDKAAVRITPQTHIIDLSETKISASYLRVGDLVKVVFVGPVAESYPVQATAGSIQEMAIYN